MSGSGFIGIDLPFTVNVFQSPLPDDFQCVMLQPYSQMLSLRSLKRLFILGTIPR